jgi:PST family polysaccharide transporter
MKWAIQIVSWAATVIIARLLSPSDYGLMGMAAVYLGLVALVNEFGLTAAILRGRDLTDSQVAQIGGFGIGVGALFCLVSVGAAVPIAHFYGEPAVRTIITVLSLNFIFSSASVLPRSLLARDLDFRRLAWIDGATNIVQLTCTIALAFLGFRWMALVFGSLVGRIAGAVLANIARPHRVAVPRQLRSISESVLVGWHVVVGSDSWNTYQNAVFARVGRVLGKVALGAYTIGWEIATLPVERVSALVGQVTPGVFSSVQADRPALRRYYLGVIEGLAFITFPGAVGISLTAPLLVPVLLGDKWTAAILPLQLLSFYAGLRSIDTVTPQVLIYTGHSRQSMWYTVLAAIVLPSLFIVGTRWGVSGVAGVWIVAYPLVVSPIYRLVFRILDLSPRAYLRAIWPATSGTAVMAAAVIATRYVLPAELDIRARLVSEVAVGVAVYAVMMLTFHRKRIQAAIAPLRSARRR